MREETAPRSCRAGMLAGGVSSQQFVCRGGGGGANKPGDHGSRALQFRFPLAEPRDASHPIGVRFAPWVSLGMEYRAEAWGGGSTPGSLRSLGPPPHPLPLGINKVGSRAHLRSPIPSHCMHVSISVRASPPGGRLLPAFTLPGCSHTERRHSQWDTIELIPLYRSGTLVPAYPLAACA